MSKALYDISIHFANPNKWSILGIYSRWEVRDEVGGKTGRSQPPRWVARAHGVSGARVHGVLQWRGPCARGPGARGHGVSSSFALSRVHGVLGGRAHGVSWDVLSSSCFLPPLSSWPWQWSLAS